MALFLIFFNFTLIFTMFTFEQLPWHDNHTFTNCNYIFLQNLVHFLIFSFWCKLICLVPNEFFSCFITATFIILHFFAALIIFFHFISRNFFFFKKILWFFQYRNLSQEISSPLSSNLFRWHLMFVQFPFFKQFCAVKRVNVYLPKFTIILPWLYFSQLRVIFFFSVFL